MFERKIGQSTHHFASAIDARTSAIRLLHDIANGMRHFANGGTTPHPAD
jgi:hypothetical protein